MVIFDIFKKPEEELKISQPKEPEVKPVKNKKGVMHVEIFLLFKFFKPVQIIRDFGFPRSTVYRYWKRYKEAKKNVVQMLKDKIPNIEQII